MKKFFIFVAFSLFSTVAQSEQLYLAHNLWQPKGTGATCINYKTGGYLVAGTPVSKARTVTIDDVSEFEIDSFSGDYLEFKANKKTITVDFNKRFHPGKTVNDYFDRLFTTKTLDERVTNEAIKTAIIDGSVIEGMSKEQVLISYGYPPEHQTHSLDKNIWMYWRNKFGRKKICFDEAGLAAQCSSVKAKTL